MVQILRNALMLFDNKLVGALLTRFSIEEHHYIHFNVHSYRRF